MDDSSALACVNRACGHDRRGAAPTRTLLILYLRAARKKARVAATVEAMNLLRDLDPAVAPGGPLSERGGVFWLTLPVTALDSAIARLSRLGYTEAVDLLVPESIDGGAGQETAPRRPIRWRRQDYLLARVYEEDAAALREQAPDRRTFLLETGDGMVRAITGYRGDGGALSRRGLPVCDARLLVNLVFAPERGMLLDPFAGIGGIVIEALASGWRVASADIDPALRHGLARLCASHAVADARRLPFAGESIDAIATEPPYDRAVEAILSPVLREMGRVLKSGGRLALLCADWQTPILRREGALLGLAPYLDTPINRKGTAVSALAWQK